KQELAHLNDCIMQDNRTGLLVWQKAIIGNKDKIIPPQNQLEYWQNQPQTKIQLIDAEHYLFNHFSGWQKLLEGVTCS
ncbi:pimeloyl-ACP methyl esterase BioG family protein, partial [Glaesserella parasuis]